MFVSKIQPQKFLFQIAHEADIRRDVENGPWTYDNHALVYHHLTPCEDAVTMELYRLAIWIQVYDLLPGFLSENVAVWIRNKVGKFLMLDMNNYNGPWCSFMHIRVILDMNKPLRKAIL